MENSKEKEEGHEECSICMENTNDCFIYPCMHELCKECSDKIRSIGNKKCYYCRGKIEDVISSKDGSVIKKPQNAQVDIPLNTENTGSRIYYSYNIVFFSNVQFYIAPE